MPSTASQTSPAVPSGSARAGEDPSYSEQLAELRQRAAEATERARRAQRAIDAGRFDAAHQVTGPLRKFRDDIDFHRPDAVAADERPAVERELTEQFLSAVRERGLVLTVLGSTGGAVAIVDPALYRELEQAQAEAADLNRQIKTIEAEHAADLEAERNRAEAEEIKAALAGDDANAIRRALSSGAPIRRR